MKTENRQELVQTNTSNPFIKTNMVNASALAKAFGKHPSNWLRLKSTRHFISGLAQIKEIPQEKLLFKIKKNYKEGKEEGIWMHKDAALEFARWLSPSFAIWNNIHTQQLLLTGKTETFTTSETLHPLEAALLNKIGYSENIINERRRKVIYHDAILQSQTLISTTVIAKELGMSARALNKMLHEKKIYIKPTHTGCYMPITRIKDTQERKPLYISTLKGITKQIVIRTGQKKDVNSFMVCCVKRK